MCKTHTLPAHASSCAPPLYACLQMQASCALCCLRGPAVYSLPAWWLQNCPQMSQEDMQRDALSYVRDWKFGVAEAIQHTPLGRITRSRITDRWGMPLV